jgi:AraC family transcriptional regulator
MTGDDDVTQLLLDMRENLDGDLGLGSLARDFGRSPWHFHRVFSGAVGETPRKHVERVRLDRAAYLLAVTDERVLDVGLTVGFQSHETFTRAFGRRFGRSPSRYRAAAKAGQRERMERMDGFRGDGCQLSEVRFVAMRPTPLLAIRRVGAYAQFDAASRAALWDEIAVWGEANDAPCGPMRMGLFPDDPGVTPGHLQKADLCLPLDRPVAGTDRYRCITLEGGVYGVIEHLGPASLVSQAYQTLADGIRRSGIYVFGEGPPVQVFHRDHPDQGLERNHYEVWFPVRKIRQAAPASRR